MRPISPRLHGGLDYATGVLLILAPTLFGFFDTGIASQVPVLLGVAAIFYSLLTRYPLGLLRVLSFGTHLKLDLVSGVFLASSPWLLGFADGVWLPHLALGGFEIAAVVLTRRDPAEEVAPPARRGRGLASRRSA